MKKRNHNLIMLFAMSIMIILVSVLLLKPSYSIEQTSRTLTIRNEVSSSPEENIKFDYLIELDDKTFTKVVNDVEFVDGQETISLEPNEEISLTFEANYKYKVTPLSEVTGYSYTPLQAQEGTLPPTEQERVESPETSDNIPLWITLFTISFTSLTGVGLYLRKRYN